MEVYEKTRTKSAMVSEPRCILVLLGFNGVRDFAKKIGMNHQTASGIIGASLFKNRAQHTVIIKAMEALNSAYLNRRGILNRAAKAYIKDWIKRWKKFAIDTLLFSISHGKTTVGSKQAEKTRERVKVALKQALDAFKWE